MTGMIHSGRQSETCPGCAQVATLHDWSCPRCGRILDRYLFGTVTEKSVTGADKDAFRAGFAACMARWKEAQSVEIGEYRPVPGRETAYRAGWQSAADKVEAKSERKRGRRRGLQLLGAGAVLTLVGGPMAAGAWGSRGWLSYTAWPYVVLGAGIVNLVLGFAALLTGHSDAVPPPPPGVTLPPHVIEDSPRVAAPTKTLAEHLDASAPSFFLSWIVIALNALVFLAMVVAGNSIFSPTANALIDWGANFGPRTTSGEWWRLETSMFLHVGLLHIAFNMFALLQIGPAIERLFGKSGFCLIYNTAGLCGGLASLVWNPYVPSAGASGAIFGLYGALLGFLALNRDVFPPELPSSLAKGAAAFIGYNLVFGLLNPNIDMGAHVGGLIAGLLCGMACGLPLTPEGIKRRRVRYALVATVAIIVLAPAAAKIPRTVDITKYLKDWRRLETTTIAKYNTALAQFRTRKTPPSEAAALLERDVFPEWNAVNDVLGKLRRLPSRQAQITAKLARYMELRHDGWVALASATPENKMAKIKEATLKQMEANEELLELARLAKIR